MKKIVLISLVFFLSSCLGIPETVKPVQEFELNRYLGTWYEIARLDHPFERGLSNISAQYTLRDDGGVSVLNKGFSTADGAWQEAEGKAYFVEAATTGYLKVSFFGPFYGSYVIFDLDKENYQYAFVSGPDLSYLWFLSRTPHVSPQLLQRFQERAGQLGFNTEELIIVEHD